MLIFQPGQAKDVTLVSIGGEKVIRGGNGIADGNSNIERVMEIEKEKGFGHEEQPDARFR